LPDGLADTLSVTLNPQENARRRTVSVKIKDLLSNVADYIFGDPIPAPEVLDDDPETSWHLWEKSVREMDELIESKRPPRPDLDE
jgi:hypothetical protein